VFCAERKGLAKPAKFFATQKIPPSKIPKRKLKRVLRGKGAVMKFSVRFANGGTNHG